MKFYFITSFVILFCFYNNIFADINTPSDNNYIPLEEYNSRYHSTNTGACVSFLPFWSGSWNIDFTLKGLSFVLLKMTGTVIMLYAITSLPPSDPGTGDVWFIGFLFYIPTSFIDAYYSFNHINNFNSENGINHQIILINSLETIKFTPYPLIVGTNSYNSYKVDGFGILISYNAW